MVSTNAAPGTSVFQLIAHDPDGHSSIRYRLESGGWNFHMLVWKYLHRLLQLNTRCDSYRQPNSHLILLVLLLWHIHYAPLSNVSISCYWETCSLSKMLGEKTKILGERGGKILINGSFSMIGGAPNSTPVALLNVHTQCPLLCNCAYMHNCINAQLHTHLKILNDWDLKEWMLKWWPWTRAALSLSSLPLVPLL